MGKFSFNISRIRNLRKVSINSGGTPADTEQPFAGIGTSASQPIDLLVPSEDSNSRPPEDFVDEEQGSLKSPDPPERLRTPNDHPYARQMSPYHSFHTRSTQAESRPTSPLRDFDPSTGQAVSEDKVRAMIRDISDLAKQESQDKQLSSPVSGASQHQHRRESSRRSLTRKPSRRTSRQELPDGYRRSSPHRRSSSYRHHDRPYRSRSRSHRESRSGGRRKSRSRSHHHRRRSSSYRDRDRDRRRRSSRHRRSRSRSRGPEKSNNMDKIVDEIPEKSNRRSRSRSRGPEKSNSMENIVDEIPEKSNSVKKIVDETIPKEEDLEKKAREKRKNLGIFVFLLMLLVIPALVAFCFFLFGPEKIKTKTNPTLPPLPTSVSTSSPTQGPIRNTLSPTLAPTELAATANPTISPSMTPTSSPSNNLEGPIRAFFLINNIDIPSLNENDPVFKAVMWLIDEAYFAEELVFPLNEKYLQRFGILVMYYSIFAEPLEAGDDVATKTPSIIGEKDVVVDVQSEYLRTPRLGEISLPNWGMRTQDECFWKGMTCNENGMLVEIKLPNRDCVGTLPKELGLFSNLKVIDFSKNKLQGSIPEELYDNLELEGMFLYKNQLSGTISSKIGELWNLTHVHLSHNQISGSIPPRMASRSKIRQIRYFNLHRNQMTGSIPSNMRLRKMFFMDLGYNKLSGTLPSELGTQYVRLRHLYLDHNRFSGTFPESTVVAGNGRISTLTVNDNQFEGAFPGNHQVYTQMLQMTIQNNNFDSMDKETCKLDVFAGGEMVEFKSECNICECGEESLMCRHCV